ncbi:MAG: aspartate--ammonia ligase [Erysipelotrichaceae bacterium]
MNNNLIIPNNYESAFDTFDTQRAIKIVKDTFEIQLSKNLNLTRVSAPLYVYSNSGLNDNLSGKEKPVSFKAKDLENEIEIVHSLAKWKRLALKQYDFWMHKGLYTDMNAIRKEESLDNLHSNYVDQWDFEKIIENEDRNLEYLKETVRQIVLALKATEYTLIGRFSFLQPIIDKDVFFITSEELLQMYPNLSSKEREIKINEKHHTTFILQIGDLLSNNQKHDDRSPDYDDWTLNGDLLIYSDILNTSVEICSMGIRVNKEKLVEQLGKANCLERLQLPYHQMLINDQLPLTIGGGIGQSRICMLLLQKAHIGEVQVSLWPIDMIQECKENNINIL